MDTLDGRTAVVTGGAGGMGLAFSERFAAAGARIVMADIESVALDEAVDGLRSTGADVIGVRTDVSVAGDLDALAAQAIEHYGQVNIVCNNAGVASGGPIWDLSLTDWQWTLGVNLWGVIHGLRSFLPHLMEHGDAHIVNTASVAGHLSYPFMGPYNASKHAVVTISETLHHELQMFGSGVRVSVLCPGLVNTGILDSDRNRPEHLQRPLDQPEPTDEQEALREMIHDVYRSALDPAVVADQVLDAILENRFYVFTDHDFDEAMATRHRDIDGRRPPTHGGTLLDGAAGGTSSPGSAEPRRR